MKRMRILLYSDFYGLLTTTFIRNEVVNLAQRHQILYLAGKVTQNDSGVSTREIVFSLPKAIKKIHWWLWNMDLLCTYKNSSFGKAFQNEINSFRPEIIHLHFGFEAIKVLQNTKTDLPVLVHFHGYDASQMMLKKSYVSRLKKLFKQKNVTPVLVSDFMVSRFKKLGLIYHEYYLLRYGINLSQFNPSERRQKPNEPKVFLQVSSLAPKKGHEYTLRAFRKALNEDPSLTGKFIYKFTGEGPRKEELIKLSEELNMQDHIQFLGNCDAKEVYQLLLSADYFVHHSVTDAQGDEEGIPNAIIEAMAMELPVLSTYHAGIPELVEHGVNGLLCDERDINTFAQQIKEITRWSFKPENRLVVDTSYNMAKHNKQLEEIYSKEMNRHHKQ